MANINGVEVDDDNELLKIPEVADAPVTSETGIAALAMNFALKYADISTVQDGTLYQQYKLEGKNLHPLHLDEVFYYASQIEKHLLNAPNRLALAVLDNALQTIEGAMVDETDDAQGIAARSDETPQAAQPEGQEPGRPTADAP